MPTWNGYLFDEPTWKDAGYAGISGMLGGMAKASGAQQWPGFATWASLGAQGFNEGRNSYLGDAMDANLAAERDRRANEEFEARIAAARAAEEAAQGEAAASGRMVDWLTNALGPDVMAGLPPADTFATPGDYSTFLSGAYSDTQKAAAAREGENKMRGVLEGIQQQLQAEGINVPLPYTGDPVTDRKTLEFGLELLQPEKKGSAESGPSAGDQRLWNREKWFAEQEIKGIEETRDEELDWISRRQDEIDEATEDYNDLKPDERENAVSPEPQSPLAAQARRLQMMPPPKIDRQKVFEEHGLTVRNAKGADTNPVKPVSPAKTTNPYVPTPEEIQQIVTEIRDSGLVPPQLADHPEFAQEVENELAAMVAHGKTKEEAVQLLVQMLAQAKPTR